MNISLTGFMGTGKTSVGMALSRMLGWRFVDTDDIIVEREGRPISLIFKEQGEDYFREVEQAVVEEVSQERDIIISTGGGVIKNRTNVENLSRRGVLVWLQADPEIILKRVMTEGGKRPLLDVKEPLNEINSLLGARLSLYKQADMAIDTNYITPDETALEVISKLALDTTMVKVDLGDRSYDIVAGSNILDRLGVRIREFRPSKVAIISNKTVFPLYRDIILGSLRAFRIAPEIILMPDGEEYKDFLWTHYLHGELLKARFDRNSLLVAVGGGVTGDITGFVASTYMRGIRFIQVPTTLLSQVDSSVGGKTGVNHPLGKNMIGSFYQPSLVFIDVRTLKTLPEREFSAGMAEIIKYGVIADRQLFDFLRDNREDICCLGDSTIHIIERSCSIKAEVVEQDERESGIRAILNYGHTLGHAIETVTGYRRFLHGEAIAIGMCAAADLSVRMGKLQKEAAEEIRDLVRLYNLPSEVPGGLSAVELCLAMEAASKPTVLMSRRRQRRSGTAMTRMPRAAWGLSMSCLTWVNITSEDLESVG